MNMSAWAFKLFSPAKAVFIPTLLINVTVTYKVIKIVFPSNIILVISHISKIFVMIVLI